MGRVSYEGSGKYKCTVGDTVTEHTHVQGVDNEGLWKFIKDCEDANGTMTVKKTVLAKRNKYSGFEGTEEEKKARMMKIIATSGGAVVGFAIAKFVMKTNKPMILIGLTLVGAGAGFMVSKMMKKK